MLFVTFLVALVVDAAVVPSQTPEFVVYTTTFTGKLDENGQLVIDNLNEDGTVGRVDRARPGQGPKGSQQFNIDVITSQKLPVQLSGQQNYRRQDERTKNINVQPQQYDRIGETRAAWQNAQDQETGLQFGGANGRGLNGDRGMKDDTASASSGLSRKSTRKPDDSASKPSKKDQSGNKDRDEAIKRQESQPARTSTESGKIQRFDYTSGIIAGFDAGKTANQNSGSLDSNSRFSANPEGDRTESANKHRTSTETGAYQRFDYTKQENIDRYDASKITADSNRKTDTKKFGTNTEDTDPSNRRTHENGGIQNNENTRTGTRVGGNEEDDDGKIYFEPNLERRKMKDRPMIVTTTPTVTLDNRNAFDVNVTCGPGMEKIAGGSCAPTE